jgi:hypothetical protein
VRVESPRAINATVDVVEKKIGRGRPTKLTNATAAQLDHRRRRNSRLLATLSLGVEVTRLLVAAPGCPIRRV